MARVGDLNFKCERSREQYDNLSGSFQPSLRLEKGKRGSKKMTNAAGERMDSTALVSDVR